MSNSLVHVVVNTLVYSVAAFGISIRLIIDTLRTSGNITKLTYGRSIEATGSIVQK